MLAFSITHMPFIRFIKFLPDSSKVSLLLSLDELIDFFNTYWQQFDNLTFSPRENQEKNKFFSNFFKEKLYARCENFLGSFAKPIRFASCCFDLKFDIQILTTEKNIDIWLCTETRIYPTKIPFLIVHFIAPVNLERILTQKQAPQLNLMEKDHLDWDLEMKNRYKTLMKTALEKKIVDIAIEFESQKLEEKMIMGQKKWLYLYEKISQFKRLREMHIEKQSYNEQSFLYDFAQQLENVLSEPQIELTITDIKDSRYNYDYGEKLSGEQRNRINIEANSIIGNFVSKCDQTLLEAWGEKTFRENLIPLEISLEDWLKAGYSPSKSTQNFFRY